MAIQKEHSFTMKLPKLHSVLNPPSRMAISSTHSSQARDSEALSSSPGPAAEFEIQVAEARAGRFMSREGGVARDKRGSAIDRNPASMRMRASRSGEGPGIIVSQRGQNGMKVTLFSFHNSGQNLTTVFNSSSLFRCHCS
jgi:hypothetical protein